MNSFYSRGKLLISGEYLVMQGAKALAVPLLKGQSLKVQKTDEKGTLTWVSREFKEIWFKAEFKLPFFDILSTSDEPTAKDLAELLVAARKLNLSFLPEEMGFEVVADLEFARQWGFGSSSSLIANVAQWAAIDAFELFRKVSNGSGYDVVCAGMDGPVFFRRTENRFRLTEVDFKPIYKDRIYFVYLGRKQDSSESVGRFLESGKTCQPETEIVSALSEKIAGAASLDVFEKSIAEHEKVIASVLKTQRLRDSGFSDLKGEIKSLGAWGGDFALLTWHESKADLLKYLEKKGLKTVFAFDEIVKNR